MKMWMIQIEHRLLYVCVTSDTYEYVPADNEDIVA